MQRPAERQCEGGMEGGRGQKAQRLTGVDGVVDGTEEETRVVVSRGVVGEEQHGHVMIP